MAEQEAQSAPSPVERPRCYCRKCGYALVGLESRNCPECGRGFDPADGRSYARRPPRGWIWRWGRRLAGVVLLLILVAGLGLCWLWWGWHAEQKTIGQLKEYNSKIETTYILPKWLGGMLGNRLGYLRQRVWKLTVSHCSAKELDGIDFDVLGRLEHLYIEDCDLGGGPHDNVGRARSVRELGITVEEGIKPNLAFAENMGGLERVWFFGQGTDDASLMHLAKHKRLKALSLYRTHVTEKGLEALRECPALKDLQIRYTRITDQGLKRLGEIASLRSLEIRYSGLTDRGITKLAQDRPDVKLKYNLK